MQRHADLTIRQSDKLANQSKEKPSQTQPAVLMVISRSRKLKDRIPKIESRPKTALSPLDSGAGKIENL